MMSEVGVVIDSCNKLIRQLSQDVFDLLAEIKKRDEEITELKEQLKHNNQQEGASE